MSNTDIGTSDQLKDPNYEIPLGPRTALGIQHVLAMFASNVTPSIIIAGAAGFAFGGEDMVFLVQMAMLFAGIATLFQTIGFGPVGARLPVMQGTSFAFVPIMIGIVKTSGIATLFGAVIVAGLFHTFLGSVIGRIRHWFPPLVTGIVITAIGLALLPVGIKYAAGGAAAFQMNAPEWGDLSRWGLALVVIFVALGVKFFTRGTMSSAAILIGLIAGYIVGYLTGQVNFSGVAKAAWFAIPQPFKYGVEFSAYAIIGMCLMSVVSAIETVGDISGIAKGGANREATDKELAGGTYADGLGSFVAGLFGGLPNTSFSQNVGLISMTGVMSRSVVTLGALFLVACGLIPCWCHCCSDANLGAWRRCYSDVRDGGQRWHQYVVRCELEPSQHDYSGDVTLNRSWPSGRAKINAAPTRFAGNADGVRLTTRCRDFGNFEPVDTRRC